MPCTLAAADGGRYTARPFYRLRLKWVSVIRLSGPMPLSDADRLLLWRLSPPPLRHPTVNPLLQLTVCGGTARLDERGQV